MRRGFDAGGVVMSTDSSGESEPDNGANSRKLVSMQQFKWTKENEDLLEEILMKHFFDFHQAARDFSKAINDNLSLT
jgi:hypothetical protein